jgi:hypothetical protein
MTREEAIRAVHQAMFPNDAAHQHMNEAVRLIRALEALGIMSFRGPVNRAITPTILVG